MALEDGGVWVWSSGNLGISWRASGGVPDNVIVDAVGADIDDVQDVCNDDVPVGVVNDDVPVGVADDDDVPVGVGDDDEPGACRAPFSETSSGTSWGTVADGLSFSLSIGCSFSCFPSGTVAVSGVEGARPYSRVATKPKSVCFTSGSARWPLGRASS